MRHFWFVVFFVAFWLVGCGQNQVAEARATEDTKSIRFILDYVISPPAEIINQAELIFVGQVRDISPTYWNQDSGEYWEEVTKEGEYETGHRAIPVHDIEMEVMSLLVDEIGVAGKVLLTAIGKSPVDEQTAIDNTVSLVGSPDHALVIGSEAIIFGRETEIAWWDGNPIRLIEPADGSPPYFEIGRKTVLQLTPGAYLLLGEDGLYYSLENGDWGKVSLAELRQQIQQYREVLVQP